jgi:hypothetical protein
MFYDTQSNMSLNHSHCKTLTVFFSLNFHVCSTPTKGPSVIYHPLGSARARNPGVTTEMVANISRGNKDKQSQAPNYCAICTLDGMYLLCFGHKIVTNIGLLGINGT